MRTTTNLADGAKRRRRGVLTINYQPSTINDPVAVAFQREREHRRVLVPEYDSVFGHVFRCVCCGRVRDEKERREPRSGLCIRCVREAGFWN